MIEKTAISKMNLTVLGLIIRVARIESGLSLRDLGTLTNISHTLISNIEKGKQTPSEQTLRDIFQVLKMDLYTEDYIHEEMSFYYRKIFTHILHHDYNDAAVLVKEMETKHDIFTHSLEVINYNIIRYLYYAITDTRKDNAEEIIARYSQVIEFFTDEQKQFFYFIRGLYYLNIDYYKQASDNFEIAVTMGNKDLDVLINEYLIRAYIRQYKFTDSVSIGERTVEEFEQRTIYVRAMRCRLLIARVYLTILRLDKSKQLVEYVESFASKFGIDVLTNECYVIRAGIYFFQNNYDESINELNRHTNQESKWLVLPRFRTYLMSKHPDLFRYYEYVLEHYENKITRKKYLIIQVLMMWLYPEYRKDKYLEILTELADLAIETVDQEYIGLAHNLLIIYYRENRKYKKALEVADTFLYHKKIHIDYYSIKNQ